MPENEFDKKVSSELQQLRFKPSDTVWMKVEERIKKKKRRRVFIILFLLAGIALLGYWQWDNFFGESKGNIVNNETPAHEKNNSTNENAQNIKKEDNSVNESIQIIKKENNLSNESTEIKTTESNKVNDKEKVEVKDNSTIKTERNISKPNILQKKVVDGKGTVLPVRDKRKNNRTNPPKKKEVTLTETDPVIVTKDEPTIVKDSSDVKHITADDVTHDTAQKAIIPDNKTDLIKVDTLVKKVDSKKDTVAKKIDSVLKTNPVDSPIVNIPKKPANKKWKFGIEFIPGKSSFNENFFSLNMNKSADVFASPGAGSGNPTPDGPVESTSGFAFQFGGFLKRQFTKRSSLSIGLRWAYYTDNIRIGGRMYPPASSPAFLQLLNALGTTSVYDAGGYSFLIINKYHFFELPVNYIFKLNKSDAHPITLNTGLKVGRMFASDALVYDSVGGGVYYNTKKYFNKTQFGISTSLNWKVTKKDKFYLAVGPVLDMHLNSLLDNPYDKKKYILFAGLRTSVLFNSKK